MAISAFVSDHGPSYINAAVVYVTIPYKLQKTAAEFKVMLSVDISLYNTFSHSFQLDRQDHILGHLDLTVFLGTEQPRQACPHLLLGRTATPDVPAAIIIPYRRTMGFKTIDYVPSSLHRVYRVTFARPDFHAGPALPVDITRPDVCTSPALPFDIWSKITMAAFNTTTTSRQDMELNVSFSLVNRVVRESGRYSYLTTTVYGNPYVFQTKRVTTKAIRYAAESLMKYDRRRITMLTLVDGQLQNDLMKNCQGLLVSLRLLCHSRLPQDLGGLQLPVLEILNVENAQLPNAWLYLGDLIGLIQRCPSLRQLEMHDVAFPEIDTVSAFPRLDKLILCNCQLDFLVSSTSEAAKFMKIAQPHTLELRGTGTAEIRLTIPKVLPNARRVFPLHLKIDDVDHTQLPVTCLIGIEEVTLTSAKPLKFLLVIKAPNLGHLKVATPLTDSQRSSIETWKTEQSLKMGSYRETYDCGSWKSVEYVYNV